MEQDRLVPQIQLIARQMLRISQSLNQIYQDQLSIVGNLTAQNMFRIDQEQHHLWVADGLFRLQFHTPQQMLERGVTDVVEADFHYMGQCAETLKDFFLQDLHFLTGDLKQQHSLFLRDKAQQLRRLWMEQVYLWIDGAHRVKCFFHHMSMVQAEIIDHLMMKAKLYKSPVMSHFVLHKKPIPHEILEMFDDIFMLDQLADEEFLAIQPLMESLDELCFSAPQLLPAPMYRIISLSYEERFNLLELNEHVDDMRLLYKHAEEQSNLLGFIRLMNRDVWYRNNLLSKPNFLEANPQIWQKKVAKLPLFDCNRAVNWLFKQSAEVLDWLSNNIQHSSVRVAVTALSFIDTSRVHPQIILATLQHFQYASARIFIHSCYDFAMQEGWFKHEDNQSVVLKGTRQTVNDHRVAISPSILYLDEWMGLMRSVVKTDDQMSKKVYLNLSRLMQTYLLHLEKITQNLPSDLMAYIRPDTQQNRDFMHTLLRHRMQLSDFRQLFYLQQGNARELVFDSYVRDYLTDFFEQHKTVPKNLTWVGLFHQAVAWHDQIQKQEIIAKLKKEFALASWQAYTQTDVLGFHDWQFEELKNLDRIIEESKMLRHCLAASYAQRIIEGEYVAFHMSCAARDKSLTLGCFLREGQLMFDQLEHRNNQKAEFEDIEVARRFIAWVNPPHP